MKRFLSLILCVCVLLPLFGCGVFDRADYELTEYTAPAEEPAADSVGYISDYAALKRAIIWLVSEHEESAELQFQNYDGNISRDLSQACWEVKSYTPLGAFAVDYTSFDLSRIVSFYQADVFITYKRSAEQVRQLETLAGLSAFRRRLTEALAAGESYLVLQMTAASLGPDTVKNSVVNAYYSDALHCPVLPAAEVSLYPDTGVERLAEITLDYGVSAEELEAMRAALAESCAALLADILPEKTVSGEASDELWVPGADELYAAARALTASCRPDAQAGASACDALTGGAANSEGMAMAFEALCQTLGAECQVVSGRKDNEEHFWNLVTLGGESYHVDVCGGDEAFLAGDDDMWGRYWWDSAAYPACPENYHYFGTPETGSSEPGFAVPEGVNIG